MAKFTNDLSLYISIIQQEEIIESLSDKYDRQSKELCLKVGIATGAIVSSSVISVNQDRPEIALLTVATLAVANSLYNFFVRQRELKQYKLDPKKNGPIDYKKIAQYHREADRYNGKLSYKSPSYFELNDKEEIEEEFGYPSDNDLPVQFLEQHLVADRIIREYELYSKRYEVPQLNIPKEVLENFINKLAEMLKKANLSHRIYYYTSEYFKRLVTKGIINYWDEINLDTLLSELDIFTIDNISMADIQELKDQLKPNEKSKKLK